METVTESIYDYPKYYDLVFGTDCAAEMKFIEAVNKKYLDGSAKQLFEPACGTGRLLYNFAKRGFQVEGNDLNEKAIEFCNKKFVRHKLEPTAWVGDMSDFASNKKFDLAFNTINSFRHLTNSDDSKSHLTCMANSGKKGSVYLIGLHLTPTNGETCDEESWAARRGHLSVITKMWTESRDPSKRIDRFGIHFDIYTPTKQFRIVDELVMRSYTADQFRALVIAEGSWTIESVYDFSYNIKLPLTLDGSIEDAVFVLRKK